MFARLVKTIRKDTEFQIEISVFAFVKKYITNSIIMKRLFVAIGFLLLCGFAIGQAQDGTAELQKTVTSRPAASMYLPYSPGVVKEALANYLAQTGNKEQNNARGYLLSSQTLIVRNSKGNADMHFIIGLKNSINSNESVIYLKLNAPSGFESGEKLAAPFAMQDAKDYLDNLAIAIKPYATQLQLQLQQKNLSVARDKSLSLIAEGDKLEYKKKKIQSQIGEKEDSIKDKSLARKKAKNDRLISENLTERMSLNDDISKQISALSLLTN